MQTCERGINVSKGLVKIARLETDAFEFLLEPSDLINSLSSSKQHIDLFTFRQQVFDPIPKHSYPMEREELSVLPISNYENWWLTQMESEARNRAERSVNKGLIVREFPFSANLVGGIWQICKESLRLGRGNSQFVRDYESIYEQTRMHVEFSTFVTACFEDELIGFIWMVNDAASVQARITGAVSKVRHLDKEPASALMAEVVRSATARRIGYIFCSHLDFDFPVRENQAKFERLYGFKRLDVPRYYVPLTRLGSLALRLGLHHRLEGRLDRELDW